MQNHVFVLDDNKARQDPVHPAEARKLLSTGKAAVYRRYPFTIILNESVTTDPEPIEVKIDPGSKTTGLALVRQDRVIFAAELTHRGQAIKDRLESRRAIRHNRRGRKTRYREARFNNRTRPEGWLSPSIKSRVDNILSWVGRFQRLGTVRSVAMELVKFDTQLMQNAEISGIEYQQGELVGYQVREYLLEKWQRQCTYCGKKDVPLEVEHITPKSRGGSNRVSNLCLACRECNEKKGNRTAQEFGFPDLQAQAKAPLKDAAAVNAARWSLFNRLMETGLPVSTGSGAMTKYNRCQRNYPKQHWIDAANVITVSDLDTSLKPLLIKAVGRGSRQMVNSDKYGFPRGKPKQAKRVHGFQSGDMVKAVIPSGKYAGTQKGKVSVRSNGSFKINGIDVNWRYCRQLWRSDGYAY